MPSSGKLLSEPIVFFGTGPVAARSLTLLAEWANIETVITKPKPAHHKGTFPVIDVASNLNIPVLTVTDRSSLDACMAKRPVKSRLGVLIDFGIIVSQSVIDYFPLGIVNSHFSALPEWRGADPITSAILSGQKQTGVSLMLLVAKMDEGPLLAQGMHDIMPSETTPGLAAHLIDLSDALLRATLPQYLDATIVARPQEEIAALFDEVPRISYSHKLTKDDGTLDFTKPAQQLEREVRAYAEWPKSRTTLAGHAVVITRARVIPGQGAPGTVWRQGKELGFYTTGDIFAIDTLKPAGKPEMSASAFLAGYGSQLR